MKRHTGEERKRGIRGRTTEERRAGGEERIDSDGSQTGEERGELITVSPKHV